VNDSNNNVQTHAVTSLISDFAVNVSDYLMPRVTFVGNDSKLADELQESLSWTIRTEEFVENGSEVYVLKNIPPNFLEIESKINIDSILIVVVDANYCLSPEVVDRLRDRISVTLLTPTHDTLLWFLKASLTLKEAAFSFGYQSRIFSVDSEHRKSIYACSEKLVEGYKNGTGSKIVISSPSLEELHKVRDVIYSPMPAEIVPKKLNDVNELKNRRGTSRYYELTCNDAGLSNLSKLLRDVKTDSVHKKKLIVFHHSESKPKDIAKSLLVLRLSSIEERQSDKILGDLISSMLLSHSSIGSESKNVVKNLQQNKDIQRVLNLYKRMSMETIILGAEGAVLDALKEKAGAVKAIAAAAGIPKSTYYKKASRHKGNQSVLSIISTK